MNRCARKSTTAAAPPAIEAPPACSFQDIHNTNNPATAMTVSRLFFICLIFAATSLGWMVLGGAMSARLGGRGAAFAEAIADGWGPPLSQPHPVAWQLSPVAADGRKPLAPPPGRASVALAFEPRQRGLLRHRTYEARFSGEFVITNPSPVTQTIYVEFRLPEGGASYYDFSFRLGEGEPSRKSPRDGVLAEAVVLAPGASAPLAVTYRARGCDEWRYQFPANARVRDFALEMSTDFSDIDFPAGSGSPTAREASPAGWNLRWDYPDVLAAQAAGMAMPAVLNAGPVAARIVFFAPVSLLFFFAVLLILGVIRGHNLHPMNYFFLAAGFFAFHLLLAYLVDHLPLHASFAIAAVVSLALVCGYLHVATRGRLTRPAALAQLAYLVLFSYSFFFQGFTGLAITIGAVATLALLMAFSARTDWSAKFKPGQAAANAGKPQTS
jgi:hypothetical protein